jgi:signal transduction histidine kinase
MTGITQADPVSQANASTNGHNPLVAQLTHLPFTEVANVLRSAADQITLAWDAAVRQAMPQMRHLTFDELKDSTPQILLAIATALASEDPQEIRGLVSSAPNQGLSRLRLNFDVVEVMQEDRLLRAITVQQVEEALGRRMDVPESAALHAAIDVMLQRSVIALVDEQKSQLRAAAEAELKFLSFLSHDLNNNLFNISLLMSCHAMDLKSTGQFGEAQDSLRLAQKSIDDTVAGMQKMLDHERLRMSAKGPTHKAVDLHELATEVAWHFNFKAAEKGVAIVVDVLPKTIVKSDAELIMLVLQNLVGNAVKYSSRGTIRISSEEAPPVDRRAIWVTDEGPGIAPDKMRHIFDAFRRGEVHGQQGVGLGLAIASQGAKLLGAELSVASELNVGSSFHLIFPPSAQE